MQDLAAEISKKFKAIEFIKKYELFESNSYYDKIGEIWTIGFGTTIYSSGEEVQEKQSISYVDATKELRTYLEKNVFPVIEKASRKVNFSEGLYIALASLLYNIGGVIENKRNLYSSLLAKNLENVAKNFIGFSYVKEKNGEKKLIPGLRSRRIAEVKLFYPDVEKLIDREGLRDA